MADISVKFVDWVLRCLPELKQAMEEVETGLRGGLVMLGRSGGRRSGSMVEKLAVRRAAVSAVADAAQRALKSMHPEQKKIYRLKYRVGLKHRQIAQRMYLSEATVERRVKEIRGVVAQAMAAVAEEDVREFRRFFDDRRSA